MLGRRNEEGDDLEARLVEWLRERLDGQDREREEALKSLTERLGDIGRYLAGAVTLLVLLGCVFVALLWYSHTETQATLMTQQRTIGEINTHSTETRRLVEDLRTDVTEQARLYGQLLGRVDVIFDRIEAEAEQAKQNAP